jgi:hypothetical protein
MDQSQPIFNVNIRSTFEDYISSLNIPFIDYFAIGIQDPINVKSASLMSRLEWQKTFYSMGFAQYDPIRLTALNSKKNFFSFDSISCLSSIGSEVMLQRKKHQMRNGIVVMDRRKTHNYMLTLATDYKEFNGPDFFLKYHADIFRILKDFSLIIKPVTANYILK